MQVLNMEQKGEIPPKMEKVQSVGKKTKKVEVTFSKEELKTAQEKADKQHLPLATYIRQAALLWGRK